MPTGVCPYCDEEITVPRRAAMVGQKLKCPECGAGLEVVAVDLVELDLDSAEEEEDWEPQRDGDGSQGEYDMPAAMCPNCDEEITVPRRARIGQKITCTECEAPLEVVDVDPVELALVFED